MTAQTGWKVLSEQKVYETKWLSVHHYECVAPTGHETIYGKVHFKQHAIGVLPVDEDGFTYLVGQDRFCFGAYSWELPEGGGPLGEAPLDAAKRELAEETNLAADHYIPLMENAHFSNSITDEVGYAFLAYGLSPCAGEPDQTEDLAVRRVHVRDVMDMMDKGEITDLFTHVMLLNAYRLANIGKLPEYIANAFLAR